MVKRTNPDTTDMAGMKRRTNLVDFVATTAALRHTKDESAERSTALAVTGSEMNSELPVVTEGQNASRSTVAMDAGKTKTNLETLGDRRRSQDLMVDSAAEPTKSMGLDTGDGRKNMVDDSKRNTALLALVVVDKMMVRAATPVKAMVRMRLRDMEAKTEDDGAETVRKTRGTDQAVEPPTITHAESNTVLQSLRLPTEWEIEQGRPRTRIQQRQPATSICRQTSIQRIMGSVSFLLWSANQHLDASPALNILKCLLGVLKLDFPTDQFLHIYLATAH